MFSFDNQVLHNYIVFDVLHLFTCLPTGALRWLAHSKKSRSLMRSGSQSLCFTGSTRSVPTSALKRSSNQPVAKASPRNSGRVFMFMPCSTVSRIVRQNLAVTACFWKLLRGGGVCGGPAIEPIRAETAEKRCPLGATFLRTTTTCSTGTTRDTSASRGAMGQPIRFSD